jgi:hypothetical protein
MSHHHHHHHNGFPTDLALVHQDMRQRGVVEREKAALGVLITMREPTRPMRVEAAAAGLYSSPGWHKIWMDARRGERALCGLLSAGRP